MKKFLYSLFAFMAIVACSNGEDIIPEIKLESSLANFTEDGGSTIINFTSTDVWTAEVDNSNDWCRVSPESGKAGKISLIISAEANSVIEDRTATVMVKSGTVKKTITISQNRKSIITSAQDEYTVDGKGEEIEIEVSHSVDFDISIDRDWITYDKTRALETDKLTFVVAENETINYRTGSITLTSKNGNISHQISVKQNGGVFELYYTSHNGQIVIPKENAYWGNEKSGAKIISNTYENGKGIITFDSMITSINSAFENRINLKSIVIPDGVTHIAYSFDGCEYLEEVSIPNSLTDIGDYTFRNCKGLKEVNIPDGVKHIGEYAFAYCSSLTDINIPNSVEMIRSGTFYGCSSLTDINIPNGVTQISYHVFYGCSSLTDINIPDGVTLISSRAFSGCSSLTNINIPKGVTKIETETFYGCESLSSINIPDGVTKIGKGAFEYCKELTNINIPDSVTEIGGYAFAYCI